MHEMIMKYQKRTRRRDVEKLILCLYRAGIDEEDAQNLFWIFH